MPFVLGLGFGGDVERVVGNRPDEAVEGFAGCGLGVAGVLQLRQEVVGQPSPNNLKSPPGFQFPVEGRLEFGAEGLATLQVTYRTFAGGSSIDFLKEIMIRLEVASKVRLKAVYATIQGGDMLPKPDVRPPLGDVDPAYILDANAGVADGDLSALDPPGVESNLSLSCSPSGGARGIAEGFGANLGGQGAFR